MTDLDNAIAQLDDSWQIVEGKKLTKAFEFKGFLKTMSFVNAVAWEANRVMHHPDMEVSFSRCVIHITTHDEGNTLTEKDVHLAQRIDALF
ncbi:4a-hydroxytetrahydrobiopterin dehydratase [Marinomonas algicola]|uniref:4a-hydroxytetrahydrobiopterin dehydratase n=1 Tax=Marinomonas algicola TaxID=2773454 RepID=UPI00174DFD22|nr:4a-hydroxytetrahydrobiopterin dehydratase [Marinomonas algicola]